MLAKKKKPTEHKEFEDLEIESKARDFGAVGNQGEKNDIVHISIMVPNGLSWQFNQHLELEHWKFGFLANT